MSGLAISFGDASREDGVERILESLAHRGPALSGTCRQGRAGLAQNYGPADLGGTPNGVEVPLLSPRDRRTRICYDGQMGNWDALAARHAVVDGPFREERLLLELYHRCGPEMLSQLGDTIFAMVLSDGDELFAARDLLGIKTLFYGYHGGTLYLASELKGLCQVTTDVHEFPPGHYMDSAGQLHPFARLPSSFTIRTDEVAQMTTTIREMIERSVRNRVDFSRPTAALLSGGMDSSVIALLATQLLRQQRGPDARLKTFALGVGESADIQHARLMAGHLGSDHEEVIVDLKTILDALPKVIYHLESFDPSLVRSSVANYLISQHAREAGFDVLLSGEGGDEIFCGYTYLKDVSSEELTAKQVECLGYLHSNACLRLDRMNQCHSLRVVAPLISGELLDYALSIPPEFKQRPTSDGKIEKWIFRQAYESELPREIVWRQKQEFSQGSGAADLLPDFFEAAVDDQDFATTREAFPFLRSKEECYYLCLFVDHFGTGLAVDTVGQWVSL